MQQIDWCLHCGTTTDKCKPSHPVKEEMFTGTTWVTLHVDMSEAFGDEMSTANRQIKLICINCHLNYELFITHMPDDAVMRCLCPWCRVANLRPYEPYEKAGVIPPILPG